MYFIVGFKKNEIEIVYLIQFFNLLIQLKKKVKYIKM